VATCNRSLNIAVKMAEMQRSLKLVDKLLDLLDERKDSFEAERKQAAALEAAAGEAEQEAAPVGFSLDLRRPISGQEEEEEEEEADVDDDTPKPAAKKARKSQVEAATKAAKKTAAQTTTTTKSASRREAGDHGAAAAAAAASASSSFSFTSVRSESGAVSVRLASRPVAAPAAATDHRESPLRADSAAKKKAGLTSNGAAAANSTTAKKKKTTNNKEGAATGPAGKRKLELTQPRLNFAKQQP
jgi:hypothetical protein